ncbi:hypothetical protein ACFQX6_01215 [Streptosporangium lutulentum]
MDYSEFNDEVDGLYRGEYAGLPIARLRPPDAPMPAADRTAWRISVNVYNPKETFEEHFARFLDTVDVGVVKAIIIGGWGEAYQEDSGVPVRLLVENAARFPALRSLFFGAMPQEECEISWIRQSDVTPLLEAFPCWSGSRSAVGPSWSCARSGTRALKSFGSRQEDCPRRSPGGRRQRFPRARIPGALARHGRLRRRHHRGSPGAHPVR